jgi:hypothetical protein
LLEEFGATRLRDPLRAAAEEVSGRMSLRAVRTLAACLALGLGLLAAPCGAEGAAACEDAACAALGQELAAGDGGLELRQLRAEKQSLALASREELDAKLADIERRGAELGRAREEVEAEISRLESKKWETSADSDQPQNQAGHGLCVDIVCGFGSHCCMGNSAGSPYGICCAPSGKCVHSVTGLVLCIH